MGVPNDDVVLIQEGKTPEEPHVITVNCPDKTGLGCDICRVILDFGLYITKGVPAEMGLIFNSRQWISPAVPNRVEAYLSLETDRKIVLNLATYESAVLGVANASKLQELRQSRPKRARPVQ